MTIKDSYPIPRMDECIDSFVEASIFMTLDAYSVYRTVSILEDHKHKSAFCAVQDIISMYVCHSG